MHPKMGQVRLSGGLTECGRDRGVGKPSLRAVARTLGRPPFHDIADAPFSEADLPDPARAGPRTIAASRRLLPAIRLTRWRLSAFAVPR